MKLRVKNLVVMANGLVLGIYQGSNYEGIDWWTNGFGLGIMWLMYLETNGDRYMTIAKECEEKLDEALYGFDGLHNDVGFMWLTSSVAAYRICGDEASRKRGLLAASILASRINIRGKFIRAWNGDKKGWGIIDSMINLPILYWATEITQDDRFKYIAMEHADTAMNALVREDGSCNHIISFDP